MKRQNPDKPKVATIGIRTTPPLKAAARAIARAERRSLSAWIEGLILDALPKKGKRSV